MSALRVPFIGLIVLTVGMLFARSFVLAQDDPQIAQPQRIEETADSSSALTLPWTQSQETAHTPARSAPSLVLGQALIEETEPNGSIPQANSLNSTNAVLRGYIYPAADEDYFSFAANAGDRVYLATMTSFAAGSSDTVVEILNSTGITLELDNDDGSLTILSSSIAGTIIPTTDTYYIRLRHNTTVGIIRPYFLHFRLQNGSPAPESEPNDTPAQANPLPVSGWVNGVIDSAADTADLYTLSLASGDTVYLGLDLDPERDAVAWNGRLGFGLFGTLNDQFILVDDPSTTSPNAESLFFTVKNSGTYYISVTPSASGTGSSTFTYHLSASVHPAETPAGSCTTYTSNTTVNLADGTTTAFLAVPGTPRIADLDVSLTLTHANMPDLDVALTAPGGNIVSLFTDVGASSQTAMNLTLDDEAGIPIGIAGITPMSPVVYQPEGATGGSRLAWFDGQTGGGVWTLTFRDDIIGNTGTLTSWGITLCQPAPLPACPDGTITTVLYSSDFETDGGGFTHTGIDDEWERGTPAYAPIATCNSGTTCWKTDLDNTYNDDSDQNLFSPVIPITGTGLIGPVYLSWAQKYQMETAAFDHAYVQVQQPGGGAPSRVWEWLDQTMSVSVGNPPITLHESAGWGLFTRDISNYLGQDVELLFHLDSDNVSELAGFAIDDVTITACAVPPPTAISLTKTVGLNPATCSTTDTLNLGLSGNDVTYCYQVSNIGTNTVFTHTLADDQLGTLLNNYVYPLAPGESTLFTVTVPITQNTVNVATWTADSGGDTAQSTDSATVTLLPPTPAISLAKTVGTDPASCAASSSLTLPFGGGDVTYCYTVQNSGNVTFTQHSLVDDQLGQLLSDFPATLLPGESIVVTVTAVITSTIANTATWTAVLPSPTYSATATAQAWVTVQQPTPSVEISPVTLSSTQPINTQVVRTLTISNIGTGDLDWQILESAPRHFYGSALYDNGPLVNSPGTGAGGADESVLQNVSLNMNGLGFAHYPSNGSRVADDFTVTGSGWQIDSVLFYAYQLDAPIDPSTITAVTLRIWDGPPGLGNSNVIFGNNSTNRLLESQWSGIYRVDEETQGNDQRPIMANLVDVNTYLPPGTYWLDWQSDGTLFSGPWAPPITINGQNTTGNARQFLGGTWQPLVDSGTLTGQGLPFVLLGAPLCSGDLPWASASPVSGSNAPGTATDVQITFDSTGLAAGTYEGGLCVSSNDPLRPFLPIPLTLNVQTGYGVTLQPESTLSGLVGTTITHTLAITNTGSTTDTFDILLTGQVWTTTLSTSTITLAAGETAVLTITVHIPITATQGDIDTAVLTATSQTDIAATDSATLTTTAIIVDPPDYTLYLPVMIRPSGD